jgi:hypothetical protein
MDYDQFIPNQPVEEKCDCSNHIRGTFVVLLLISLLYDCVTSCRRNRKIERLKNENKTLKNLILASVDKALVKMMKNGNDSESEHDE